MDRSGDSYTTEMGRCYKLALTRESIVKYLLAHYYYVPHERRASFKGQTLGLSEMGEGEGV